ncbi:glycosyltransferase [Chlorobium phaeovibrioides]|uniref:glycosyltransferase n=1 Tax=Chlorobium phaeovibrioides TaxID=1094 RepID=UPI00174E7A75|nr:glycosyltransferase [Chlorobium phaeovibrioides]
MKTISIVMPCLNAVSYIEDALRSIDNQNDNDIELIVIDGGSTDGTLELLEKKKWPISVLISEPDKGAPDALNKGFSLAKGDVLGWLNADDTYISENVISIVTFSDPFVDFAYGHSVGISAEGIVTKTSFAWPMTLRDYQRGSDIFTGSLFFSSHAWKEFAGFDLKYTVIFEYELIDFLLANFTPVLINKHIAALRHYPGTLSDRLRFRINEECVELRGNKKKMDVQFLLNRLYSLSNKKLLNEAIKNSFKDKFAGRNWEDVFKIND